MAIISSAIQTFKSLITVESDKEGDADVSTPPSFPCPVCDQTMTVQDVRRMETVGLADARVHAMKCETCGMMADRVYHPSIGYDHAFVV